MDRVVYAKVLANGAGGIQAEIEGEVYGPGVPALDPDLQVGDSAPVGFLNPGSNRQPLILSHKPRLLELPPGSLTRPSSAGVGNGQWLTPEADYRNSCGLTEPTKQLILKLDGSKPGTLRVLESDIQRFEIREEWGEKARLTHYAKHVDQLGLIAYTQQANGRSSTILARYSTMWVAPYGIDGHLGVIHEYDIGGEPSAIAEWVFSFHEISESPYTYENLGSRNGYRAQVDRRAGYFFADILTESRAIYMVCLDSGIHTLRKSDGTQHFANWFPDPLRPQSAGAVTAWGKYVFECGWSGYDKSNTAFNDFNATIGYVDPATLYLPLRDNSLIRLPLPDNTTYRADLRYYVRSDDFSTYTTMSLSLLGLVDGKVTRKILSCGIYTYGDTRILLADGSAAGSLLDTGPGWNLQSSRWPLWISAESKTIWFWLASMVDGETAEKPGASYFQIFALNFAAGSLSKKGEMVSSKVVLEPYPGWKADRMAEHAALATASQSTQTQTGYHTTSAVVAHDPWGNPQVIPYATYFYNVGWTYEGIDPAYKEEYDEADQYLPHPWPCPGGPDAYLSLVNTNDAIAISSRATPSGCFDSQGNHYMIVSEPIKVYTTMGSNYVYNPRPSDIPPWAFWLPTLAETLHHEDSGTIAWFSGYKGLQGWYTDYYQWYNTPHTVVRAYTRHDKYPFHYWLVDPDQWPLDAQPWTDEYDFYYARVEDLPTILEFTCLSGYDRGEIEHLGSVTLPYPGNLEVVDAAYFTNKKTSFPSHEIRYVTYLVKTTAGGAQTKLDITQRFSWSGASYYHSKAVDMPFALNCWQWAAVGDYLFCLRQMYQSGGMVRDPSISNPATDLQDEAPWLEVRSLSDLKLVGRLPLWPDPKSKLRCQYDTPPRMVVGVDINGNAWAQVFSSWNERSYDDYYRDLAKNWNVKNEFVVKKARLEQFAIHGWTGLAEVGMPSPTEASTLVINNGRAYWIDQGNSVVEYTAP